MRRGQLHRSDIRVRVEQRLQSRERILGLSCRKLYGRQALPGARIVALQFQ